MFHSSESIRDKNYDKLPHLKISLVDICIDGRHYALGITRAE